MMIYALVVFIGGALLAPWLYGLAQTIAPGSKLAAHPFHRYLDRCFMCLALIGIWPLFRALGLTTAKDLGIVNFSGQGKRLAMGFALGFVSLACAALIAWLAHARKGNVDLTVLSLFSKLGVAAGTAVAAGVLEELLFRGAIFGALRRSWHWRAALLVSSMIYAVLHFLGRTEAAGPISWHTGLEMLPRIMRFGDFQEVIPGVINLTLAGIMLGLAYQRTGNLYFSIGLHVGWIFWVKAYGVITVGVGAESAFWGSGNLVDGWLALLILVATLLVLPRLLQNQVGNGADDSPRPIA
jgi:membrane protease YdiL (CAAX protease family)